TPPSKLEAKYYYTSLPSRPVLVARTKAPTSPKAYLRAKELCTIGNHALKEVWEDKLSLQLHAILDSMKVRWSSTNIIHIGITGESSTPIILWVGMMPTSLSRDDGIIVASKCWDLLEEYNITDVNIEICESVVTCLSSPRLLKPAKSFDPTIDVCECLTMTVGLPICAQNTPWAKGTGSLFINKGRNTERLLLLTTHHVVFTPNKSKNWLFKYKKGPHDNVMLFGDAAFNKYLESIQAEIETKAIIINLCKRFIKAIEGKDDAAEVRECQKFEIELNKVNKVIGALNTFYQDVSTCWATPESHVLGHIILSPPINVDVGNKGYTEDWALIEVDASKVDGGNFNGNAIDLRTDIPPIRLTRKMYPNPWNAHSFTYPANHLLRLKGTIQDNEMHNPTALDQNGEPCLPIIMHGSTSSLSIGHANNIMSYAQEYYDDSTDTLKEWAILSYNSKSSAFLSKGDSGSVIADGLGRIGSILTGGTGIMDSLDITYATPITFVLKRMQENGIRKPNVSLVLTA
ncbi:hypothetical protein BJV78DRAFT_1144064, partial [Lactifluus subvellereus]